MFDILSFVEQVNPYVKIIIGFSPLLALVYYKKKIKSPFKFLAIAYLSVLGLMVLMIPIAGLLLVISMGVESQALSIISVAMIPLMSLASTLLVLVFLSKRM